MRWRRWAVLPVAVACVAHHSAEAAGPVTIIRGTTVTEVGTAGTHAKPVIIRGIAPGTSWSPEPAPAEAAERPATVPVTGAGGSLWLVRPDGTLSACSVRGSGTVDSVSRDVIVCTDQVID